MVTYLRKEEPPSMYISSYLDLLMPVVSHDTVIIKELAIIYNNKILVNMNKQKIDIQINKRKYYGWRKNV